MPTKEKENKHIEANTAMKTPPIVSAQEWEAAHQQMLVKEKALTRSRDALAAERRRMPWMLIEKKYEFEGPNGKVSLLDLFEGRRQLGLYRAFFEPGAFGWPDHACRGCSLGADQVSHLAHLNARDTTLAWASRAPHVDIARLKSRMGWAMPWYTFTDSFDKDFGVDEWHGHNVFFRHDSGKIFRTYFINNRGDEALGTVWSYLDIDRKSTRLNSSHLVISYAVFCLKKKTESKHHRGPCELAAEFLQRQRHGRFDASLLSLIVQHTPRRSARRTMYINVSAATCSTHT